jgi:hypothetical protein
MAELGSPAGVHVVGGGVAAGDRVRVKETTDAAALQS